MTAYLYAESIKIRRTSVLKLIWIVPLINILIGNLSPLFFQIFNMNLWYMTLSGISIGILGSTVFSQIDGRLQDQVILLSTDRTAAISLAKAAIVAILFLISNVLILFGNILVGRLLGVQEFALVPSKLVYAILLVFLTKLYLIPLIGILSGIFGRILTIILSVLFIFADLRFCSGNLWFALPFSITSRLMSTIIRVLPNGLVNQGELALLTRGEILMGIAVSIAYTSFFTALMAFYYRRKR